MHQAVHILILIGILNMRIVIYSKKNNTTLNKNYYQSDLAGI